MFVIYCHTHRASGLRYVGLTKRSMMSRWMQHVGDAIRARPYPFHRAIRKHGQDAFEHEELETVSTLSEANESERRWVAHFRSNDRKFGYNLCAGGEARTAHPSTRQKLSKRMRAVNAARSPEQRTALTASAREAGSAPHMPAKLAEAQRKRHAKREPSERSAEMRSVRVAQTPADRDAAVRKASESWTREKRAAAALAAKERETPEARARTTESVKRCHALRSPEERAEVARRMNAGKTPEQRRAAALKGYAAKRARAEAAA